ncbi:hypothetical protein HHK36_001747 [Tetracentron sinense]|uniref:Uncharacterized protein n=1 Tax=Tetracentron sinense TaxID=13715 RepID=A0A834ZU79_TETSI|nr:hypothetical protein HHK36_001747 [Tetracentron sinense]
MRLFDISAIPNLDINVVICYWFLTQSIYISSKEVLLVRLFGISAIPNLDINVVICYCSG